MDTVTLKAHFDGKQIVLDEPYDLPKGSPLAVTILPQADLSETSDWYRVAAQSLSRAYGDEEPDYSVADVKR